MFGRYRRRTSALSMTTPRQGGTAHACCAGEMVVVVEVPWRIPKRRKNRTGTEQTNIIGERCVMRDGNAKKIAGFAAFR